MDGVTIVVGGAVLLQAMQLVQIALVRRDVRDVRQSIRPQPMPEGQCTCGHDSLLHLSDVFDQFGACTRCTCRRYRVRA
jgi:hypothetical protein